jgi:hypothetical protein
VKNRHSPYFISSADKYGFFFFSIQAALSFPLLLLFFFVFFFPLCMLFAFTESEVAMGGAGVSDDSKMFQSSYRSI